MSELVIETVPATFTRRKGELTKIHKELAKASPDMIKFLLDQVKDVRLDPKVRQAAAIKLISFDIEVSKIINADNMTRMLADIKYADKLLGGKTSEDGDNKPGRPMVDFDNIMDVEEN